jgi:hypothetical protein
MGIIGTSRSCEVSVGVYCAYRGYRLLYRSYTWRESICIVLCGLRLDVYE